MKTALAPYATNISASFHNESTTGLIYGGRWALWPDWVDKTSNLTVYNRRRDLAFDEQ